MNHEILMETEVDGAEPYAALLRRVLEDYRHVYQKILMTDNTEKTVQFYTSAGFTPAPDIGCLSFLKIHLQK